MSFQDASLVVRSFRTNEKSLARGGTGWLAWEPTVVRHWG